MPTDLSPLWISLKTASVATVVAFVLGVWAAWRLYDKGPSPLRSWLEGLFLAPLVLPPTVIGFVLLFAFGKQGPLGKLIAALFDVSLVFTQSACTVAQAVVAFPLMFMTARGAFRQVDVNVLRAARSLGATELRILVRVLIPLAWPGLVAGVLLSFARALGEFGATLMLAGNIPGVTQTIPVALFFDVEAGDLHRATFWTVLVITLSCSMVALFNLFTEKRSAKLPSHPRQANQSSVTNTANRRLPAPQQGPATGLTTGLATGLAIRLKKNLGSFVFDVDFTCAAGTRLAVLGPSGAGKSLLLRLIAKLELPDSGSLSLGPSQRVGMVFQDYALFPHLSVVSNIAFGLADVPQEERRRRVKKYCAAARLEGLEHRLPRELSGGQQQRVALARALATEPQLLLLDEPFSALDSHLRSQIELEFGEILDQFAGITLLVTHNSEEAYRLCTQIMVLDAGQVVRMGSKEDVFADPKSPVAARLAGYRNISRVQISNPGHLDALCWGCSFVYDGPLPPGTQGLAIHPRAISLEASTSKNNTFVCRIVGVQETPFLVHLLLQPKNFADTGSPAKRNVQNAMQVELSRETWEAYKKAEGFGAHTELAHCLVAARINFASNVRQGGCVFLNTIE